jgi:hypothetical protein
VTRFIALVSFIFLSLAITGCAEKSAPPAKPPSKEEEIQAALSKLSPENRALAEAQKMCPVSNEPLGSMGTPEEVKLDGQTVFICCGHCKKRAEQDPAKTLAKVKELKEKNAAK